MMKILSIALALMTSLGSMHIFAEPQAKPEQKPSDGGAQNTGSGYGMGYGVLMRPGWMHGSGMGACSLVEENTDLDVKNIADGVTITITSKDSNTVKRIQKRAQILKLSHELHE